MDLMIQKFYIYLFTPFIYWVNKMNDKMKYRLITFCFIILSIQFSIIKYFLDFENPIAGITVGCFLLIGIGILSLEEKLELKKWNPKIYIPWMLFCFSILISDLLVNKMFTGMGMIYGLVFPAIFFIWENSKEKERLWECLINAIKIVFVISSIICFLFRPYIVGGRYSGLFTNPNMFGLYLVAFFSVFIAELDKDIKSTTEVSKWIPNMIFTSLAVYFLVITQARTSFIACIFILLTWMVFRFVVNHKKGEKSVFGKYIFVLFIVTIITNPIYHMTLRNLPVLIDYPIKLADDVVYYTGGGLDKKEFDIQDQEMEEVVIDEYGVLAKNNPIYRFFDGLDNSSWDKITNGRITIYKAYARRLNMFGHSNIKMRINGFKIAHAHNNLLQYAYSYGIINMLFYALICMSGVYYSIKFFINKHNDMNVNSFLPMAVIIGVVISTIMETLFLPFEVFPAFLFWFAFGGLFLYEKDKTAGV